ncbi:hypothetical protein NHX12_011282 [Muraenolepis orangiensis]|uniref:Uncharacterized protein n=1 Tax=Muraenolepis orangiensis TaxID=630683 RepID=A0A9Q0DFJ6_9TELE|nr:hypothetical protein NHX12_011282 [Muraenolepis orangiensis]
MSADSRADATWRSPWGTTLEETAGPEVRPRQQGLRSEAAMGGGGTFVLGLLIHRRGPESTCGENPTRRRRDPLDRPLRADGVFTVELCLWPYRFPPGIMSPLSLGPDRWCHMTSDSCAAAADPPATRHPDSHPARHPLPFPPTTPPPFRDPLRPNV